MSSFSEFRPSSVVFKRLFEAVHKYDFLVVLVVMYYLSKVQNRDTGTCIDFRVPCCYKMSADVNTATRGLDLELPTPKFRWVRVLWNSNIPSISKLNWLKSYYKYIKLIFISIIKQSLKEIISSYKYTKKHQSERSQKDWTEHGF